jgi:hypothetical protein
LLHVGVCCKWLARKGLLKGSKEIEITGYKIGTLKKAVQDLPMAVQEPFTSLDGSMRRMLHSIVASRERLHSVTREQNA